jgi:predicted nucleic acid-binding protein
VTLTDAGPVIALVNRNDPNHSACVEAAKRLPAEPLTTTWPCITEAMYLLHRAGGFPAQNDLWRLLSAGRLALHELSASEIIRMAEVMAKYHDLPMDLADASIVAAAERLGQRRIFTLDRDFFVYRFGDGAAPEVIP